MSSMHKKAATFAVLLASAGTVGAALAPNVGLKLGTAAVQSAPAPVQRQAVTPAPAPPAIGSRISTALARWNSLRQSDNLPFSAYASFLTSHRGWPGETAMRRTAERAIDPNGTRSGEVIAYFRIMPPLTGIGHTRHAFALLAEGQIEQARAAARTAWESGVLPRADEDRLLASFGAAFGPQDHDRRMETLLANGDTVSALRTFGYASPARRPVYQARLALQTGAADTDSRLAAIGDLANSDPGVLRDRANRMRDTSQSPAARALLARSRTLSSRPHDVEKWYETLLVMARGAENDRQWSTAYQIASQIDDAYAPGTDISAQSYGERDDYTSLAWLAGTVALHRLNRPADAETMFVRYANGGRSSQVLTKGYYWAGRAAQASGQVIRAQSHFGRAAAYPELFYGQLALEQLNRPVPAPAAATAVEITAADRAAFHQKDLVQAVRLLGQLGSWSDQSTFVRALSENAANDKERALATELARQIGRPDLSVWVARSARNDGSPFYVRAGYPEVRIPPAQSHLWSLAHGIMRQESSFDRAAMSPVGARGMMQLMPPTARETSGKMGLPYDLARLTRDPDYNIMLGSRYFAGLMDQWGGYAPLAIASYNAGAGNVRKWIRANGDPRTPGVDIVRWIEEIPFSETKGYVQRVLENAVVYDALNPSQVRTRPTTRLSYYLGKSRPG
ncbi:lytic transglycosylase domain-containing protein [Enterovirga sp. GCM10030262]|uniref:lytic transglycosylase domain-containing protein n=1 Tax=Enterovirga sp. GCM10030262 TaxID=3273391 RepID=UPI00361D9FA8